LTSLGLGESARGQSSPRRVHDFLDGLHRAVGRTGGVRIDHLDAYRQNPGLDREARAPIVREQCFRIDGRSGERVGHLLLALARGRSAAGVTSPVERERAATSA
jgi:hypothetical protein